MVRALEFIASDVQGVRLEFSWTVAADRRTCRNVLDAACEAAKVQIAVQLPRACERLIGIPMPVPRPGMQISAVSLRVLAPADAFMRLRADAAPASSLRIDFADSGPLQDNELRVMIGRGTFGCRLVT